MIQTYSSRLFERDKAGQWLELLRGRLHWPVAYDRVDEKAFEADIEYFTIGDIRVLHHGMSRVALLRTTAGTAGVPRSFSLNFVTRGRLILSHYDKQSILGSGDIVLADGGKPSRLMFVEPTRIVTVGIPDALLTAHIPQPERMCNLVLKPQHHFSAAIRAALLGILDMERRGVPEEMERQAIQPLLGMLSVSYLANFGWRLGKSGAHSGARLEEIRQYIDEHVTEHDLTPESIAERFGVSTRYLRKLFAADSDSVSRYIQRRRLEKSADRLRNLLWQGRSITDICYDCGFKSAPHFTRAFKARFGVTPNEYRKHVAIR